MSNDAAEPLIIPALRPVYAALSAPVEALLRIVCGGALMVHGTPKMLSPIAASGMVAEIGFAPAALWSVLLSFGEFLSGLGLLVGFLTRPAAVVATVILLVTVYFHWVHLGQGYSGAEKSILWAAITLFFAVHGARAFAIDRRLPRRF